MLPSFRELLQEVDNRPTQAARRETARPAPLPYHDPSTPAWHHEARPPPPVKGGPPKPSKLAAPVWSGHDQLSELQSLRSVHAAPSLPTPAARYPQHPQALTPEALRHIEAMLPHMDERRGAQMQRSLSALAGGRPVAASTPFRPAVALHHNNDNNHDPSISVLGRSILSGICHAPPTQPFPHALPQPHAHAHRSAPPSLAPPRVFASVPPMVSLPPLLRSVPHAPPRPATLPVAPSPTPSPVPSVVVGDHAGQEGAEGRGKKRKRVSAAERDPENYLQCKGINLKKRVQCGNSALMDYIGPRPQYCAEHIQFDKDSLYQKCVVVRAVGSLKQKFCKEVVLKEFKVCFKHLQEHLATNPAFEGEPGVRNTTALRDRCSELLKQLQQEANDARHANPELFQRKIKLIPKYQSMLTTLNTHLARLGAHDHDHDHDHDHANN